MALLHHYTCLNGLEGIANSQTLWATRFLDLNDSSEFIYAWKKIYCSAIETLRKIIPLDIQNLECDIDALGVSVASALKERCNLAGGYGQPYITSFARATSEDEDKRGILTLWDRYTKFEGYCLQFDQNEIRQLIDADKKISNYEWIDFSKVRYGIEANDPKFQELTFQVSQNMLIELLRVRNDIRVEPCDGRWPINRLARELVDYCAIHKDECWKDEREFRVYAYPSAKAEGRIFTGLAMSKEIYSSPKNKNYIVLGESIRPGISPKRIIIGPKAERNIEAILKNFQRLPEVVLANLPIA